MLPKKERLSAAEVRAILKNGRSARSGALSAKYALAEPRKAAVVVRSATVKRAVDRNKVRRSAYQTLGECLPRRVQAVIFVHAPHCDPQELSILCSKLI